MKLCREVTVLTINTYCQVPLSVPGPLELSNLSSDSKHYLTSGKCWIDLPQPFVKGGRCRYVPLIKGELIKNTQSQPFFF